MPFVCSPLLSWALWLLFLELLFAAHQRAAPGFAGNRRRVKKEISRVLEVQLWGIACSYPDSLNVILTIKTWSLL